MSAGQGRGGPHYDEDGTYVGCPACPRCQEAQRNLELALIDESCPDDDHVVVAEWTRPDGQP